MQKNKKILICIFFFVIVGRAEAAPPPTAVINQKKVAQKNEQPVIELFSENKKLMALVETDTDASEIVVNSSWGERNPFDGVAVKSFLAVPDPALAKDSLKNKKFILSGIVWTGAKPSAVINNNVVGVGGMVWGAKVKSIKEGSVVLTNGVEDLVLSMRRK